MVFNLRLVSANDLYARLDAMGCVHVSLNRGGEIDLFVGDEDADRLQSLTADLPSPGGICTVNVFAVGGGHGSDYLGFSCLPNTLARRALADRVAAAGGGYQPAPATRVLGLAYRLVYHFNLQCGIDWRDEARLNPTDMATALRNAISASGKKLSLDHCSLHNHLVKHGFGVTTERLAAYLRHDFKAGRKVFFHAWLINHLPGELNLFVIRSIATEKNRQDELIERLRELYDVLAVKTVSPERRARAASVMRDGRWDRGGEPAVAVAVFDRRPRATSEDQRRVHAFVFNAKQLIKQDWREWFIRSTDADEHDNPIHSTDNEAEALVHLPLFFDGREMQDILRRVEKIRGRAGQAPGAVDGWRLRRSPP
ncbi:MAG TPA: hypothetical protein VIT83_00470 [Gammaproteobacteria bacterium]